MLGCDVYKRCPAWQKLLRIDLTNSTAAGEPLCIVHQICVLPDAPIFAL